MADNVMNILQAMQTRRSVRTFDARSLAGSLKDRLLEVVGDSSSPFGGEVEIRMERFALKGPQSPGTYGVVSGATDYFLIGLGDDELSALSAGFRFEQVVLRAWQLGLGTCWIGGTFKGGSFDRGQSWPSGVRLGLISPVGQPARKSLREKFTRFAMRCDSRQPFGSMFFDGDFDTPLSSESTFGEALAMLRLAPSSVNSQPWRALVSGNSVHFYCKRNNSFSVIDTGIGICHFVETEKFYGHAGEFLFEQPAVGAPGNLKYIVSYNRLS